MVAETTRSQATAVENVVPHGRNEILDPETPTMNEFATIHGSENR
ncbi:hypothetical protein A2U01_0075421, partial [Trifolium medium]|nr:hypothetical protein [Trifolium medium]